MKSFTIQKNTTEQIQISEKKYKDNKYIDVRVWYLDEKSNEYKPTKKGVMFSEDCWEEFIDKLKEQVEENDKKDEESY